MTEREKFSIGEAKERNFKRDGYTCGYCGLSIHRKNTPQLAHIISQTKSNLKKYGTEIIHSDYNMKACCQLDPCNSGIACGKSREQAEAERIRKIIEEEKAEC